MKSILLVLSFLFCLVTNAVDNKYFEGVIHYKTEITRQSKSKRAIRYEESLYEGYDSTVDFYYKNGQHCYIWGPGQAVEVILNKSKFLYQKGSETDVWYKTDVHKKNQDVLSVKILDRTEVVAGYECQILELITVPKKIEGAKKYKRTFYFNKEFFKINKGYIKNYKYNSQYLVYRKIKSACLRFVIEFNGCTVDLKAHSVEFKKVDDNLFKVPK